MSAQQRKQAELLLAKQLKELLKNPVDGFSVGLEDESNLLAWNVCIVGPPDSPYEGGMFNARLVFPEEYPMKPPTLQFTSEIWHPNIFLDNRVCISILHEPGEDPLHYELSGERWLPVHTVETILISVISILSSPNDESPANIEAAKEWRSNRALFNKKVAKCVRKSQDF